MQGQKFLYTVYRNKGDELLILDGSGRECAEAMGITLLAFRRLCMEKGENGINGKWTVIKTPIKEVAKYYEI